MIIACSPSAAPFAAARSAIILEGRTRETSPPFGFAAAAGAAAGAIFTGSAPAPPKPPNMLLSFVVVVAEICLPSASYLMS